MSLDVNLFTLNFTPDKQNPNITDLVDPSDNPHYRKERIPGSEYRINVYDPISQSLLASATAPSPTSKVKSIELHNPSHVVELKYVGTINFKWRFKWEEHEFEWKREECYIVRKPDPAVLVAVTKEPSGRIRTSTVQILDYNLNRFDIQDRKGLEIVLLTALLTFQDTNEAHHTSQTDVPTSPVRPSLFGTRQVSDPISTHRRTESVALPPSLPPKPAPKTGVERISELHMLRAAQGEGEANEIEVGEEGRMEDYAAYAEGLLKDDAMLFVTIRSASAVQVPKVLQVVEQTKRLRHKAGLDEDQELFQYVVYDTAKKGPKRINLNDPSPAPRNYAPPTSLSIHLSKIDMPELQPRVSEPTRTVPTKSRTPSGSSASSPPVMPSLQSQHPELPKDNIRLSEKEKQREKERQKAADKEREKALKKAEKEAKKAAKNKKNEPPQPNKLTRPMIVTSGPPSGVYTPPPPSSAHIPPPTSTKTRPSRPASYHPSMSSGPSYMPPSGPTPPFPQPQSDLQYQQPISPFYSGISFPSSAPLGGAPPPPPTHPTLLSTSPRPASFYGSGASGAMSYNAYNC